MAISVLMVYQPIESTRERENYWRSYVNFYEKYWDGPATPQSSWFGKEYDDFRKSLSLELGLNKNDIQDCFFLKNDEGKYFIVPVGSEVNINLFSAENFIPFEWFLMFSKEEKNYFYTHTGYGAIAHDAIYYKGSVIDAKERLEKSQENIKIAQQNLENNSSQFLAEALVELDSNISNLLNWLEGFDSTSFIILNYGEICSYIEPNSMKNEDSVSEIQNVIANAAHGKIEESESALSYLISKWNEIRGAITGDRPESASSVQ